MRRERDLEEEGESHITLSTRPLLSIVATEYNSETEFDNNLNTQSSAHVWGF